MNRLRQWPRGPITILHLSSAQQLYNAINDPNLNESIEYFFRSKRAEGQEELLAGVCAEERDVLKESFIAGKIKAYEDAMHDLKYFAENELEAAK